MIEIQELIDQELERQNNGIELIASENYVSKEILDITGSIFTNKYAEGYPGKRYYGGCEIVDKVEQYAIDLVTRLFGFKYANVQPHSGSQANYAAYKALIPNGGKILSLALTDGGHLTHGSPVSFSGTEYHIVHYGLNENGEIDYDQVEALAAKEKPDVLVAGFSAYPHRIDFQRLKNIAFMNGAKLMIDMAHIAGLIAANQYGLNDIRLADIVTSTTHKTLRGPRGGFILTSNEDLIKKVNKAIFPYSQGGPLMHIIAAKAQCFKEAFQPMFTTYIKRVISNTETASGTFKELGVKVYSGGTHLLLLDTINSYNLTGAEAQTKLESIGITVNKNMIPKDTLKPNETSGLRIGFAAVTTRGCDKEDTTKIVKVIHDFLRNKISQIEAELKVKEIVKDWEDISKL